MKRKLAIGLAAVVGATLAVVVFYQLQSGGADSAPFSVVVVPTYVRESAPGQRCVLLVTVKDEGEGRGAGKPVRISADAFGATVQIEHEEILPGEVAEVSVVPSDTMVDKNITVTVTGKRGLVEKATATIPVVEWGNEEPELAPQIRDMFISWLEANHPELNITGQTEWSGTLVTPRFLVVTHYLYFSEEWEMHVYWHVMIEPYNWARIELRQRFKELSPSLAFEMSSYTSAPEPYAIEPPEELWR